jgi:tetratricopeptide (TPR) repeat protein
MPDPRPTSHLGLYRSGITGPDHRRAITVGRQAVLQDTLEILRKNAGRKPKHHQLFIGPRGIGKTHLLSLIEDAIGGDPDLSRAYQVIRFPEESNRTLSFADFLLGLCEIMRDTLPGEAEWAEHWGRLATVEDDARIVDTLVPAIRQRRRATGQALLIMMENLHQVFESQIKDARSIAALRGFLMEDNGCLLLATAPLHFGAITDPGAPFFDFFDVQILDQLSDEETIELIRRNLEWEKRDDLLASFADLRPRLLALYRMTGGSPRLSLMLYELIANEAVAGVRKQFEILLDRITPFYQDRMSDLGPQERAVLETIAVIRDQPRTPALIASRMRMKPAQVSALLGRLTKAQYLRVEDNPEDKRSRLYTIREGFFDIWLAMNNSRGARIRLPFLVEFFAQFYPTIEQRNQKRAELAQKLKDKDDPARAPDLKEGLDYLSEVGDGTERAAEKVRLAALTAARGEGDKSRFYVREARLLPLHPVGEWITTHTDRFAETDYLGEVENMIACWEAHRTGGMEAFVEKLRELGGQLTYKTWSEFRIDFLRDQIKALPVGVDKVDMQLRLGKLFQDQARWVDAEEQYTQARSTAEEIGDDDWTIQTVNNIALLLQATNRPSEAEPLVRRVLAFAEQRYGENHPVVATALNDLAVLLKDTNRLSEAEALFRRALAIDEQSSGENHAGVGRDLSNLALLLIGKDRLLEAEPFLRRAHSIAEQCYGENHPNFARSLNNMVVLLYAMNRLSEAEPLMRRALAIAVKSYGENHPEVARYLNNMAQLLQATNRFAEAEPLMRRALAIVEQSFGENHTDIAVALNNLAMLLQATSRLPEAEPLMWRQLGILIDFTRRTGPPHPYLDTALNNYRGLLVAMGRGEADIRKTLEELCGRFGVEPPRPDPAQG